MPCPEGRGSIRFWPLSFAPGRLTAAPALGSGVPGPCPGDPSGLLPRWSSGSPTSGLVGASSAGRSHCLLSQQSPGLLASLGAGLLTLLGLALGSYLVRRSRRPRITLLDPDEKYLLRLIDKTVSCGGRGGAAEGPELPSCWEATASSPGGAFW